MDGVKIALLWHMHQPSYIKNGQMFMPWVFLHAIKDYYDMPYLAAEKGVKVTFNLTPTLLEQLLMYQNPHNDYFISLLLKNTGELSDGERKFLFKILKSLNYDTMVKPYNSFDRLYKKAFLNDRELLNLQVWYLLSWCGNYLKSRNTTVRQLLNKTEFSENDKKELVYELLSFVNGVVPYYRKLFLEGVIDITTTPFYHPILPLLIDMNVAKKADPSIKLPKGIISLEDDAQKHIELAIKQFQSLFSKKPEGFWPSEGAVDEKSVLLYKNAGVKWIATDEAILKKSGYGDTGRVYGFKGVKIYFRNHMLSDLIGFTYKFYEPENAVNDFYTRLKRGLNVVILDGENAWEYYKNNGRDFLEAFYKRFRESFVPFNREADMELEKLVPGSWIYGNFNTWVGDEEKNRAWELLFDTKRDYVRYGKILPEVRSEFLKAQGSDWFWWYGKGHYTQYAKEFDSLFRNHLKKIYALMNLPYPKVLDEPVVGRNELKNILSEPKGYIYPVIDGKVTHFFEWIDAGVLYEGGGVMQENEKIKYLYWGENRDRFFIRLDGENIKMYKYRVFFEEKELKTETVKEEIVEIAIDKSQFFKKEGVMRIEVLSEGKVIQILPSSTRLFIKIDNNYLKNWYV